MARLALLVLCALASMGAIAPVHQFAEGQVWEYHTRPGDKGSLLKIQKIERVPAFARYGPIFHVTIIGVRFGKRKDPPDSIDHAPFSRGALDASVTQLSAATAVFPDAAEGIAEWHKVGGGVFSMPVANAVESVAQTLKGAEKPRKRLPKR
jgi:hypothetical protein